jgi:ADP-heptose:LPS heptosyltransferase
MEDRYMYLFPFEKIKYGSKILIYGAGILGQEYLKQIQITNYCKIVGFLDRNFDKYDSMIVPVFSPEKASVLDYDKIVIALRNDHALLEVKRILHNNNVSEDDIVYVFQRNFEDYNGFQIKKRDNNGVEYAFSSDDISIALYCIGGFGDAIIQKKFLTKLIDISPKCKIDIYHIKADKILPHLYNKGGNINEFIIDNGVLYHKMLGRYVLSMTVRGMFLKVDWVDSNKLKKMNVSLNNKIEKLKDFEKKENVSFTVPLHLEFMRKIYNGENCYTSLSCGGIFDITDDKVHIPLDNRYLEQYNNLQLSNINYITINSGNGDSQDFKLIAKTWPPEYYEKVVSLIKDYYRELQVVQVGGRDVYRIEEADSYMLGENIELVKYVLKNALIHLDIEGGLVHLATQLGTKCIVLFGPTDERFYGYKQNINIKAGNCHGCYGLYTDINKCTREMEKPECMYSITPELVVNNIVNYLDGILNK